MITNKSVHVIITILTAKITGAKVWGSTKLDLMPGGGGKTGIPDKFAWSWIRAAHHNTLTIGIADSPLVAKTWLLGEGVKKATPEKVFERMVLPWAPQFMILGKPGFSIILWGKASYTRGPWALMCRTSFEVIFRANATSVFKMRLVGLQLT